MASRTTAERGRGAPGAGGRPASALGQCPPCPPTGAGEPGRAGAPSARLWGHRDCAPPTLPAPLSVLLIGLGSPHPRSPCGRLVSCADLGQGSQPSSDTYRCTRSTSLGGSTVRRVSSGLEPGGRAGSGAGAGRCRRNRAVWPRVECGSGGAPRLPEGEAGAGAPLHLLPPTLTFHSVPKLLGRRRHPSHCFREGSAGQYCPCPANAETRGAGGERV